MYVKMTAKVSIKSYLKIASPSYFPKVCLCKAHSGYIWAQATKVFKMSLPMPTLGICGPRLPKCLK